MIQQEVKQTMSVAWGCDICTAPTSTLVSYDTRTAIEREDNETHLTNTWTETKWDVCEKCAELVDMEGRAGLMERAIEIGELTPIAAAGLLDGLFTPLSRHKIRNEDAHV